MLAGRITDPVCNRADRVVRVSEVRQLQQDRPLFAACQSDLNPPMRGVVDDTVHLDSPRVACRGDHAAAELLEQILRRWRAADLRERAVPSAAVCVADQLTDGAADEILEPNRAM